MTDHGRHIGASRGAILTGLLVGLFAITFTAPADAEEKTRRYALVVANNGSVDKDVKPLRYADDDGARFYELFSSLADDARLLTTLDADSQKVFPELAAETTAPTRKNLRDAVEDLRADLERDAENDVKTELYLVFTGHGNVDENGEGYLSLADGKLRRSDLYREVIRPLDADFTHLIIDACHAYFMVNSRGGTGEDWEDDRSGEKLDNELEAYLAGRGEAADPMNTVGVILSTAGAAEVHEWSRFRAGVFSHELRSGLLGAADADGDGRVGYREIEAYLMAANASVTNPNARIHVFAKPPAQDRNHALASLDDYRNVSQLEIPKGIGGRYYVEDSRGLRYADMHVDPSAATRLVLLREPVGDAPYYLRTDVAQAEVETRTDVVRSVELAFNEAEDQSRGAVEEEFRTNLFKTPYGPAFVAGFTAGREAANDGAARESVKQLRPGWQFELALELGSGSVVLDEADGLQHQLTGSALFHHDSGWAVGPFVGYGLSLAELQAQNADGSTQTIDTRIHRIALGVETAYLLAVAPEIELGPRVRLGNQSLILSDDESAKADPIGLRSEVAALLGWQVTETLSVTAHVGLAGDVVSRVGAEENEEQLVLNPHGGLGVRF